MKTISLSKELVIKNISEEFEEILAQIDNSDKEIVLDFSGTDVIDTSGVQMIFLLAEKNPETDFKLANVSENLMKVFVLLGFDSGFEFVEVLNKEVA